MRFQPTEAAFDWGVAPGRVLQRELDARGVTQAQLAGRSGLSTKHVNLVVKGHASLSADMAIALEQVLDIPAEIWLRAEATHRAAVARHERRSALDGIAEWAGHFPTSLLRERGILKPGDTAGAEVERLLKFFGVATLSAFEKTWLEPQASYRRSQKFTVDPYLTALWLRLAERDALELAKRAAVFDPERLRQAARRLPPLTRKKTAKGFAEARALMLEAGVTLVFVPEIKDTRISGVSRHVNGTPMIAVTSRYRYCDALWFTVLHEVAHLLLHPKRATFIDFDGKASDDDDAQETAANAFAADLLVPPATRPRLIAASSVAEVTELAEELRVNPGILAGQRAHLTGDWGGQLARLRRREDLAAALA